MCVKSNLKIVECNYKECQEFSQTALTVCVICFEEFSGALMLQFFYLMSNGLHGLVEFQDHLFSARYGDRNLGARYADGFEGPTPYW